MPLDEFAKFLSEEPSSLFVDFTTLFLGIMADMMIEFAVLGLSFALFRSCAMSLYILDSHSPGLQTVSLQSHGLIFWIIPSWMAGKYIFHDAICRFCLFLAFF